MARKKKEKIIVKLDLPKDDTTLTKLYAILGVSIFLGLASFTFWVTNSHFTTAPNGQPLFVNMACGYDANYVPTFDDNESCQFGLLKDEPDVLVMTPEDPWKEFIGLGQLFDVPGMDENITASVRPQQTLTGTCKVETAIPSDYSFIIKDPSGVEITRYSGNSHANGDNCEVFIQNMEKGNLYQLIMISEVEVQEATYRLEMDYYDGLPENMNNKSQWIGPEVDLGGISLRPTIFLNFFGIGFFIMFWPASFYWDRVKEKTNQMEEKFPDFLRYLAEYW